jgi:hypothetical protein
MILKGVEVKFKELFTLLNSQLSDLLGKDNQFQKQVI